MKNKVIAFVSVCLLIILSIPSVPVLADEPSSGVRFYTIDSVDGFFTGSIGSTSEEDIASSIYIVPNSFVTSDIINALNNFPSDPNNGNTSPLTSGYWFVCVNYQLNSMVVYWPLERYNNIDIDWASGNPVLTANSSGDISFNACFSTAPSTTCYMMQSSYNFNTHVWGSPVGYTMTTLSDSQNIFNFRIAGLVGNPNNHILSVSDTLNYLYSETQYAYESQSSSIIYYDFIHSVYTNEYNYVNFLPASLPYYDGNDIVIPDDGFSEESNENHMYFKSCDFGFCEPYNVNNFSNFGGAYFYVKYNVDDWVLNHIGDYKIEFHVDCYVGNQHFPFTTRESLDPDLVFTIPFSYFDGFNYGFSTYITNQKIDKSFLKTQLYCIKPEQYVNFYNKLNSVQSTESLNNMLNELADNDLDFPFLFCYTDSSVTTLIKDSILSTQFLNNLYYNNRFTITCNARLIDESGNESGWISREFDLVRGSSISTNNDGLTNENPYTDDNDDYLPDVPENEEIIKNSVSGTGVNVYNMTPNQIKLTIDNGLERFVNWYNSDASVGTTVNGFWASFGIFKNNPATELYEEYFGFLPDTFKTIMLGAATISIVGGVFCMLRKKLT